MPLFTSTYKTLPSRSHHLDECFSVGAAASLCTRQPPPPRIGGPFFVIFSYFFRVFFFRSAWRSDPPSAARGGNWNEPLWSISTFITKSKFHTGTLWSIKIHKIQIIRGFFLFFSFGNFFPLFSAPWLYAGGWLAESTKFRDFGPRGNKTHVCTQSQMALVITNNPKVIKIWKREF